MHKQVKESLEKFRDNFLFQEFKDTLEPPEISKEAQIEYKKRIDILINQTLAQIHELYIKEMEEVVNKDKLRKKIISIILEVAMGHHMIYQQYEANAADSADEIIAEIKRELAN